MLGMRVSYIFILFYSFDLLCKSASFTIDNPVCPLSSLRGVGERERENERVELKPTSAQDEPESGWRCRSRVWGQRSRRPAPLRPRKWPPACCRRPRGSYASPASAASATPPFCRLCLRVANIHRRRTLEMNPLNFSYFTERLHKNEKLCLSVTMT